ncbi:polysaccharide deacetylase family protein [Limnofasciculus baicalensis]|uniref:Polysaccharide deacetylase family protein n=1 Tax=Limnofasciculus baicalensis BBK-W-15 TaxID=2699891 RepID=A0AAE3GV53_9CYAN|nr:polysaccharide deacetylase family protein [Limnofasciculus baicalensis]MCP2731246.1 polysaccharide deacetylase family protein [Limnofasciculus baicalensis BBK-W-15]
MAKHHRIRFRQLIFITLVVVSAFLSIGIYRIANPATRAQEMNSDIQTETRIESYDKLANPLERNSSVASDGEPIGNPILDTSIQSKKTPLRENEKEIEQSQSLNSDKQQELFTTPKTEDSASPSLNDDKVDRKGNSPSLNSDKQQEVSTRSSGNDLAPSGVSGTNQSVDNIIPQDKAVDSSSTNSLSQKSPIGETPSSNFLVPTKFHSKVVHKIKPSEEDKVIALTFDDGPWPRTTEQVLDILKKNNMISTFFWIGENVQNYPKIAQKVVTDGHVIGNHTWHHWYHKMDRATVTKEIERTADIIFEKTGVKTSLFRPPGGVLNNGLVDYAQKKKDTIVMWSDDAIDYRPLSANQLVRNVLRKAEPGAIVLMHDGGGNRSQTVKALPEIIEQLTQLGYRFVTVPELLEMDHPLSEG